MTWEESPHATIDPATDRAAAACTDCHGVYTDRHPDDDLMELSISSATCASCHSGIHATWTPSVHAQAGVQCIGCHQAHSQQLRLQPQELCVTCHTLPHDDAFHVAHWLNDVTCTDCHMAGNEPVHDFVTVSSTMCVECHRNDVQGSSWTNDDVNRAQQLADEATNEKLADELDATQADLRTMQGLTPVALGLGLGVGGFLGIVFMLAMARQDAAVRDEHDARRQGDDA